MPNITHLKTTTPTARISPRFYGHFAEHLARCCYDGLWVGPASSIPNTRGWRNDLIHALQQMPVPMVRWPGGCYADHYHWRDGIGQRTPRLGISCGTRVTDTNELGTHEFMDLCELLQAEPYLAGNMATGSVQEMCDWLEYTSGTADTSVTRERKRNGRANPWDVKLWGVGNESWDCGGRYDARTYAAEFKRYAVMMKHVDPSVELVAVGNDEVAASRADHMQNDWNDLFMDHVQDHLDLVDQLSVHTYWIDGGSETGFSEEHYYTLLAEADTTEEAIVRAKTTIDKYARGRKDIKVALDEYGVWHPETRPWGPGPHVEDRPFNFEQANTIRDALSVGIALEGFHRQARILGLANLAQIVNVLQSVAMTDGEKMFLTPTYHALKLHEHHISGMGFGVEVQTERLFGQQRVSATASQKAGVTTLTVINRHISESSTVHLHDLPEVLLEARMLSASSPDAVNSHSDPERIQLQPLDAHRKGNVWVVDLPAHSMATLRFRHA
ncbi:alpha-N-arabinofuranosidase [Deinococcus misasensis]|uniref:alpha-N-arabinofuranosidase n=1 Tax=Deinococcus misasensis TaxID=392413 RepID=UPI00069173C1|nr:alpha-L-arabinofuranosidase C-terminal domain-containing protein [Deinococcus misasensis]